LQIHTQWRRPGHTTHYMLRFGVRHKVNKSFKAVPGDKKPVNAAWGNIRCLPQSLFIVRTMQNTQTPVWGQNVAFQNLKHVVHIVTTGL
jgi:hypothetical protein